MLTNVLGTRNLLEGAIKWNVPYFLNVSTDKAAEPTSILGKTKRIAELLVINQRNMGQKGFTNVRFGNVFNSKGSVIETFQHQILNGVSITLTDPGMMRYFMHIDEAAALAIKSSAINAGAIHILDMGEPIKMLEIIERLKLALNSRANVEVTGARSGEKLNEDLMNEFESLGKTKNSKIRTLNAIQSGIKLDEELKIDSDLEAINFIDKTLHNND